MRVRLEPHASLAREAREIQPSRRVRPCEAREIRTCTALRHASEAWETSNLQASAVRVSREIFQPPTHTHYNHHRNRRHPSPARSCRRHLLRRRRPCHPHALPVRRRGQKVAAAPASNPEPTHDPNLPRPTRTLICRHAAHMLSRNPRPRRRALAADLVVGEAAAAAAPVLSTRTHPSPVARPHHGARCSGEQTPC